MRDREAEFQGRGAHLAAVGLADAEHAREFRKESGIAFPLLVDGERVAYRAAALGSGTLLGILRPTNMAARRRARAGGHRQQRLGRHPFQLGGSFILGPGNVDLFLKRNRTFGDHPDAAELLAALER